jgi:hypothetical protein
MENTKIKIENSSTIVEVEYHKEEQNLDVTFKAGKTYRYYGVPEEVYNEFIKAESLGKYLNANIKSFKTEAI